MTDQVLMRSLKEEIKNSQKKMKEYKNDPEKMMEMQKKAMETNMKYMGHSMKPTLVSFIPIILIFSWMYAHLAYEPIMPGQEFNVTAAFSEGVSGNATIKVPEGFSVVNGETQEIKENTIKSLFGSTKEGKAEWVLNSPGAINNPEGDNYILEFEAEGDVEGKDILVTYEQKYEEPTKMFRDSKFKTINLIHRPVKPLGEISIFGWKPGWLGVYIISSLIFSMSMRKILKLS